MTRAFRRFAVLGLLLFSLLGPWVSLRAQVSAPDPTTEQTAE